MTERVPWLDYLVRHIGLREIPGPVHERKIVEWGRDAGISWWNNDEDAWCAVAVNGALVNSGYPSTKSALARSFTKYGTRLDKPIRGAVVVFPRGKNPLYGHVGIVEDVFDDGTMSVISGNMSNRVKRATFRIASLLPDGVRWPPGAPLPDGTTSETADEWGERVMRLGSRGEDVSALQRDLNVLNYALTVDGIYGGRTVDAVRRFQVRRGMEASGAADEATLAALTAAVDARRNRDARREVAAKAAAPMAGAGAIVTAGAAVTASVEMAREVRSLDDGTVVGIVLMGIVFAAVAGLMLWRFSLRRAAGNGGEDLV